LGGLRFIVLSGGVRKPCGEFRPAFSVSAMKRRG
jgi:hypothetical protein